MFSQCHLLILQIIQLLNLSADSQAFYFIVHSVRNDFTGLAMAALIA